RPARRGRPREVRAPGAPRDRHRVHAGPRGAWGDPGTEWRLAGADPQRYGLALRRGVPSAPRSRSRRGRPRPLGRSVRLPARMAQAAPPPRDGARAAEPDGHLAVARAGSAESRRSRTDDGRTHTGAYMDDLTERQAATRRELVQAL